MKLKDIWDRLPEIDGTEKLIVPDTNQKFYVVLGKKFHDTCNVEYVLKSLIKRFEKYGVRAHAAKDMDGKDWKSLSHSLRSLYEAYELLGNGRIAYPLSSATVLQVVKQGRISLVEFEIAYNDLERLVKDFTNKHIRENYYDRTKVNQMVLNLYKKEDTDDERQ